MEWINQLVGFLIVLFILLFPLLKKALSPKKKQEPPVEKHEEFAYEEEREKGPTPKILPPERKLKEDFEFHSKIEEREFQTKINQRHLQVKVSPKYEDRIGSEKWKTSIRKQGKKEEILEFLKQRNRKQSLVISSEIIQPPKSVRGDEY